MTPHDRVFRYTARWRPYALVVAVFVALTAVEVAFIDVLIVATVHADTPKALLLGAVSVVHLLLLGAVFGPPVVTRHRLASTHLHLRYGYDALMVPRADIVVARPVEVSVDLFTFVRARLDAGSGRAVAVFSSQGQVLLELDRPHRFRAGGLDGDVREILINVDRRDELLRALARPRFPLDDVPVAAPSCVA